MKVAFDDQCFRMQNLGGISRYNNELMARLAGLDVQVVRNTSYTGNAFDSHGRRGLRPRLESRVEGYVLGSVRLVTGRDLFGKFTRKKEERESWLSDQSFDIFHPTYYDPYFLPHLHDRPFVLTVHDMIHEIFPEHFPLDDPTREWKRRLAGKAAAIVANSESTKRDLLRFIEIDESKVVVIHLGCSLKADSGIEIPNAPWKHWQYLLFVGNRTAYKNFFFMLQALEPIFARNPEMKMVCVGGGEFQEAEKRFFESLDLRSRMHHVQVNDDHLVSVYSNALAFVFPSLYEGFGLPVLEAFECGCSVLASKSSSLPEVGGDAALYFDPKDASSIYDAVVKVIEDEALREELRRKGRERRKAFSWNQTAIRTKELYEQVLLARR
jgi:glycosyltransferase involved in cell wall biosynthesis